MDEPHIRLIKGMAVQCAVFLLQVALYAAILLNHQKICPPRSLSMAKVIHCKPYLAGRSLLKVVRYSRASARLDFMATLPNLSMSDLPQYMAQDNWLSILAFLRIISAPYHGSRKSLKVRVMLPILDQAYSWCTNPSLHFRVTRVRASGTDSLTEQRYLHKSGNTDFLSAVQLGSAFYDDCAQGNQASARLQVTLLHDKVFLVRALHLGEFADP